MPFSNVPLAPPTIYEQINHVQDWIRENQAKASDDVFMGKVAELRALMNEAYTTSDGKGF